MANKRYKGDTGFAFPRRGLTIIFGAVPATVFSWYAVLAVFVGVLQILGLGAVFLLFGAAGLLGTYSLWAVAFGYESKLVVAGLIAGSVAMIPMLLVPSSILPDITGVDRVALTTALEACPVIVALHWLGYFFLRGGARQIAANRLSRSRN